MSQRYRIGIVGFGMAGGLSAYLLAKDGHEVTLLEQSPVVGPAGAGVLLQMSGQAILRHLGVLDQVLKRAAPLECLDARHVMGGQLIKTSYCDFEADCHAYGVHRGVLFEAIHDLVNTQPVALELGCTIVRRVVESDGVYLVDSHFKKHGPFDFVLVGDGARSRLRKACGFVASVTAYDHGTLWLIAPGSPVPNKLLQVVRGNHKLFGLLPLGDGLSTLYWGLPVRDFAKLRARGLPALKAEILTFAPESAEILDFLYDFDQLLLTSYQHVWMPRWFDRHMLFLGDAAHAMSPHMGQGINLAMVDAWRFAECLRAAPDPHTAFHTFYERQCAYIRYYATMTYMLSPFFQADWSILGWGRDIALPLMPRIPWVKRQMLMTVAGMKGGFLKGRIEL